MTPSRRVLSCWKKSAAGEPWSYSLTEWTRPAGLIPPRSGKGSKIATFEFTPSDSGGISPTMTSRPDPRVSGRWLTRRNSPTVGFSWLHEVTSFRKSTGRSPTRSTRRRGISYVPVLAAATGRSSLRPPEKEYLRYLRRLSSSSFSMHPGP